MADEVEQYRLRKGIARRATPLAPEVDQEESPLTLPSQAEQYVVRKQEIRAQNAAAAALQVENAGDPDQNAADATLAREYQTEVNPDVTPPTSFVSNNRDRMSQALARQRATTALSTSPLLTRWLHDEANAKLAADDVPALAGVEHGLYAAGRALERGTVHRYTQVANQFAADTVAERIPLYDNRTFAERYRDARGPRYDQGFFGTSPEIQAQNEEVYRLMDEAETPEERMALLGRLNMEGETPNNAFFTALGGTVDLFIQETVLGRTREDQVEKVVGYQQAAAEAVQAAQARPFSEAAQRALAALKSPDPATPMTLGEAVQTTLNLAVSDPGALAAMVAEVGVESAGALIPAAGVTAVTRSPAAGATTLGALSYTVERNTAPVEFFTKRGYDLTNEDDIARMLANPELMQEAAEKGHTRGLIIGALDTVSGGIAGKVLARNAAADLALQALVQGALGGGGEGIAQYVTEGKVDYGQVVIEALAEFATAPIDVAAVGGRYLRTRQQEAAAATERAEVVAELSQTATESRLRGRSPEAFRSFVEQATNDTAMETMYFPADAFIGYFQSQGVPLEQVAELLPGVDMAQVRRAAATGEDITMPTATYMDRVAGSDMDQFVIDNAKFSPQDMSPTEARAFEEGLQLETARVSAQQEAARATQTEAQVAETEIHTAVTDQLVAAGRSRVAAQQEAQLYPAFYRALAARTGRSVPEVVAQYALPAVRGPQIAAPQARQVDTLTRDLAGMRARIAILEGAGPEGVKTAARAATPENEYLDTVEQTVRDAGLDPATATDDEVRAAVKTLNQAGLIELADDGEGSALIQQNGQERGQISYTVKGDAVRINRTDVAEEHQAQGVGTEAYTQFVTAQLAQGRVVESDAVVFDNAAKIYARLEQEGFTVIQSGAARRVAPGTKLSTRPRGEGAGTFAQTNDPDFRANWEPVFTVTAAPKSLSQADVDQTQTAAFKEWFGDSQVVDENGDPLVVYHGTPAEGFTEFDASKIGSKTDAGFAGHGFYFSSDPTVADAYGKNTIAAYLRIENPYDFTGQNFYKVVQSHGGPQAFSVWLREQGYDGAKLWSQYMTLDNVQIKASEGNSGAFDANDANIYAQSQYNAVADIPTEGVDVSVAEDDTEIRLARIVAGTRSEGAGTSYMNALTAYADQTGKRVVLTPSKDFGGSVGRLRAFYKRFGFVENKGRNKDYTTQEGMLRTPQTPTYAQGERGRISIPKDGPGSGAAVIDMFKNADLSTFLHESSHFFLSIMQDTAMQPDAPVEVQQMLDQAKTWWGSNAAAVAKESGAGVTEADVNTYLSQGTTGDAAKDSAIDTGTQEQWARAFETYLMEGKAPTPALRGAFEQFRAWLMEVYKRVRGDLNVNVTDDIRQVFDMLLATDEEIAATREDHSGDMIGSTAAELGVTEEDYAQLAALHQEAQDQSAAATIAAAMAPIRRMRDDAYKARLAEIRNEVSEEVNARPVYRAVEWMGNKRWLGLEEGEQPTIPAGMRLNKEQLVERYGPGVLRTLPRGSFRVYTPNGMDIDEAAGWFGFSSGDEMVQAMEKAPKRGEVIAAETDRRATAELAKEEGTAQAAETATDAFHTDKRGDYIAAELRTLNKNTDGKGTSTASYARQVAKRTMSGLRARDAMASNRYLAAERRAAEAAQAAFAQGDRKLAADHKRKQLFNHMMFVESRRVADEIGKTERLARRLQGKGTRKNLANDYLGAIDDVLEQYDFRKVGPGKERSRERMLAYVEMMKEAGRENEIAIPQHILDNAKAEPYMTLTVDRVRGVYATLQNIESTARRAQKLIDAQSERDMTQVVNDITDAFTTNLKMKPPARVQSKGERTRNSFRQFFDLILNADTLLREIDGFQETEGPAYQNLKEGLDAANSRLQVRRAEAAEKFHELYSVYTPKERNQMAVSTFVPELDTSMAKWDLISIVLNMGNADNVQRLTDPRVKGSFTPAQLDAVVARMDKRDLDFAQSIWDYIDSFYGEIAAREKRVTGVTPQKVQAQELQTAHGTYAGGYYPLKYDPRLSDRVAEETTDAIMDNMRAGRFGKAQTQNGHTKERAQSSGRAVMLDIGVLHSHVNTVLHDLEMSEPVTNTWRILQDPRVKGLFLDSGRQVDHQALEMWVQDTASGQVNSADVMSRTARFLKSGFTVSKLAFNLSTVAVQITGVAQSMVVIGRKDFTAGAAQYLKNPVQTSQDVLARSAFMQERETTFNKDIYDIMGDIKVGPKAGVYQRAMQNYIGPASFYLMQKVQFYAVDMPTWLGAYQKGLRDTGGSEAEATQIADRAVARAQASGVFSDRSPIERGTLTPTIRQNDFVRMFTALGSYMFAKANVAYERTGKTDFRSPKEVLSYSIDMALLFTVEAVLYNAIKGTLPGMGDDVEDDEGWAEFLAKETALSVMSTMPFVRDFSSPLQGFSGGGSYGSITETLMKPFLQAAQGEVDRAFVKSIVDSGGMLLHLPASQVNRFIDAGWRQSEGEDVAPIEYIMGKR